MRGVLISWAFLHCVYTKDIASRHKEVSLRFLKRYTFEVVDYKTTRMRKLVSPLFIACDLMTLLIFVFLIVRSIASIPFGPKNFDIWSSCCSFIIMLEF